MTRTRRIFQVDAFTDRPLTGNPACVVPDAADLSEEDMRAIAGEINRGDTAFVLPPASGDEDLRVRFFSPRKELPFVGHATLATHAVLALSDPRPRRRQGGAAGIVEVRALDGGGFSIWQPAPVMGREPSVRELDEVLELLGLTRRELDAALPPRIAGNASTRLLLAVNDAAALDQLRPRQQALAALSPRLGAQGYFVFAHVVDNGETVTRSRMFCPALGIDEDPVSGNAHAMLGVHLHSQGRLAARDGTARFTGLQGQHMGRPGRVDVGIDVGPEGRATGASIAGRAVIVLEGSLRLA